jgi:hypothetical protein
MAIVRGIEHVLPESIIVSTSPPLVDGHPLAVVPFSHADGAQVREMFAYAFVARHQRRSQPVLDEFGDATSKRDMTLPR